MPIGAADDVQKVLDERAQIRGTFTDQARISQNLKIVFRSDPAKWERLSVEQKEALDNMANKMARVLTGDPNEKDAWLDMGGYPTLIYNLLTKGTHV